MSEQNRAKLSVFEGKQIRKVLHEGAWWFAIVDVVAALTDSVNPADYFKKMRKRDFELNALLKGGDKLPPPLRWRSRRLADGGASLREKSGITGGSPVLRGECERLELMFRAGGGSNSHYGMTGTTGMPSRAHYERIRPRFTCL